MSKLKQVVSDLIALAQNERLMGPSAPVPNNWIRRTDSTAGFDHQSDRFAPGCNYFHRDEVETVRTILNQGADSADVISMQEDITSRFDLTYVVFVKELQNQLNKARYPVEPRPAVPMPAPEPCEPGSVLTHVPPPMISPVRYQPTPWPSGALPPVGIKCEIRFKPDPTSLDKTDKWVTVVVAAEHHEGGVFVSIEGCWYLIDDPSRFRPIRTEAQKRRDELRDRLVNLSGLPNKFVDMIIVITEEVYGK